MMFLILQLFLLFGCYIWSTYYERPEYMYTQHHKHTCTHTYIQMHASKQTPHRNKQHIQFHRTPYIIEKRNTKNISNQVSTQLCKVFPLSGCNSFILENTVNRYKSYYLFSSFQVCSISRNHLIYLYMSTISYHQKLHIDKNIYVALQYNEHHLNVC